MTDETTLLPNKEGAPFGNSNAKKHGLYREHKNLFGVYGSMKNRCYNPKRDSYERYGARGIGVCEEWRNSPESFVRWALDNGYEKGLQLDRIDNDGDYSPDNCRWVTPKENCRNTRRNKTLTLIGQTKTVAEWCEVLDISEFTIYWWIRKFGQDEAERRVYERLASSKAKVIEE